MSRLSWAAGGKPFTAGSSGERARALAHDANEDKTRLLLILSQDLLDQARVIAGRATTAFKLPVSLQIVLRALIWVGLKRDSHQALLANIEGQARAVRQKRSRARRAGEGRQLR